MALASKTDPDWFVVAIADLNDDDKADIVWRHRTDGRNEAWVMDGAAAVMRGPLPRVKNLDRHIVGVGDFDLDGKHDLVFRDFETGANTLWVMDGVSVRVRLNLPSLNANWRPAP